MAGSPLEDYGILAQPKSGGECEWVDLPGISTAAGNRLGVDNNGFLFVPEASEETINIDCNRVTGQAQGVTFRTDNISNGSQDLRDLFVMPGAVGLFGNVDLTFTVGDDFTNQEEIIDSFTINTPCSYDASLFGYYHVRGLNDIIQFVGNVQHNVQLFETGSTTPIVTLSGVNVFNNENSNPAPGSTGADPTEDERQVPMVGTFTVPEGLTSYEVRLVLNSTSNVVEQGSVNFNQYRFTYTIPSRIHCVDR